MIRQAQSDAEQNPEMEKCVSRGADATFDSIRLYLDHVRDAGFAPADAETHGAGIMLIGALFHDAMSREFMPHLFLPAATAPAMYAKLCLRSIGFTPAAVLAQRRAS